MEMEEKKIDRIVSESSPKISQIILVENGRGGLKVNYNVAQTINGVVNNKKRSEQVTRPVHKEVRDGFGMLKEHLLSACEYYWPNDNIKKMLLAKCVVTTVVVDKKDNLQLKGYMLRDGTHHSAIATAVLDAEGYGAYSTLYEIVENICEQSRLFMSGVKGADARTIVVDYMTVKKEVINAEEAYDKLTEAEVEEITREALKDSGLRFVMEDGVMVVSAVAEDDNNQLSMDIMEDDEVEFESVIVEEPAAAIEVEEAEIVEEMPFVDPDGVDEEADFIG